MTNVCRLPGDVLENYCHEDDLMNVARFLFATTIMLTFPIECFVTREVSLRDARKMGSMRRHMQSESVICAR